MNVDWFLKAQIVRNQLFKVKNEGISYKTTGKNMKNIGEFLKIFVNSCKFCTKDSICDNIPIII